MLGLVGGTGLVSGAIVILRRRRLPEEVAELAGEPLAPATAFRPSRLAGSHPVEDPILAAMGLGETSQPDRNAPITRSVNVGPGERPCRPDTELTRNDRATRRLPIHALVADRLDRLGVELVPDDRDAR